MYVTVPIEALEKIHESHAMFSPTDITEQPWGDACFEVRIENHQYMIAGC